MACAEGTSLKATRVGLGGPFTCKSRSTAYVQPKGPGPKEGPKSNKHARAHPSGKIKRDAPNIITEPGAPKL